jgi:transcriptional regulator with XRE-family HTH domain
VTGIMEISAWRLLLGQIIADTAERQRIANELGISPVTLSRWASNTTNPRPQSLQQLLHILPRQRDALYASMCEEFPEITTIVDEHDEGDPSREIPSQFYARVLSAYVETPKIQRFWSIANNVLLQALGQLDPNSIGLAVTIAQCQSPNPGMPVRSLRESVGRATPPWESNLEQKAIFLGAESMAGYALTSCRSLVIQSREERGTVYPAHWVQWEESAAAYPIMLAGVVAGCLLVSSTQPGFFLPFRLNLIQNYAELLALAFDPEDFYALDQIDLRVMPQYDRQEQYVSHIQQRTSTIMLQGARDGSPLNFVEAQQIALREVEEAFIALAFTQEA